MIINLPLKGKFVKARKTKDGKEFYSLTVDGNNETSDQSVLMLPMLTHYLFNLSGGEGT